jgi:hypothetical protein
MATPLWPEHKARISPAFSSWYAKPAGGVSDGPANKRKNRKDSAGSDDTANMIKELAEYVAEQVSHSSLQDTRATVHPWRLAAELSFGSSIFKVIISIPDGPKFGSCCF